ncbi:MAG: response regulator [Silicimonas sp.]|nr:response regulator [Silicimonas sp.]
MSALLAEAYPTPGRPLGTSPRAALVLDDCEFDRQKMRRLVEEADLPFDLIDVDTIEAMEAALTERDFDLILIDYYLVGGTGFEALERIAAHPGKSPVSIMITGDEQVEIAVQAIKKGCADYLAKADLSPEVLSRAIRDAEERRKVQSWQSKVRLKSVESEDGPVVLRYSSAVRPEMVQLVRDLRAQGPGRPDARSTPPKCLEGFKERYGKLSARLHGADDPQPV